ncbi:SpoIIAA family protein [Alteromonas gilva]|uniref:STAS/SEC14 domain-containing protein n=1 Tax=Alteromonas gilva TaxID=2987522 RepID=A0ABT5L686_9ALTE|nr:STAS/SEC14 domain-containing protein [Alteromonas gilva]MDC8832578.1 STAS/SEC14 domain-containing protein [Alteromonas gilva]
MNKVAHGISIGIERIDNTLYVSMKAIGKLTHRDYEAFTPLLEGALASIASPQIRLLFDATEFTGWEMRAAWDDFKIGLRHGSEFSKVAIVGQENWQALMAAIGNWFVSGEVVFFTDTQLALNWLCE